MVPAAFAMLPAIFLPVRQLSHYIFVILLGIVSRVAVALEVRVESDNTLKIMTNRFIGIMESRSRGATAYFPTIELTDGSRGKNACNRIA